MRSGLVIGLMATAIVAAPALAQAHGGPGGGGPGGGFGGGIGHGMGAGPPISPPGLGSDPRGSADDIAAQRGQFGRDFAAQQRLTAEEYQAQAAQHRADARKLADLARSGANIPDNAKGRIRGAMKADMDAWREQFSVGRHDWQAMRDQWLVDKNSLTAAQWAQRRSDWFAARDAWIANQKSWAKAHVSR